MTVQKIKKGATRPTLYSLITAMTRTAPNTHKYESPMLKRISIKNLRLGMYITEFCGSWMEHPFWKAKFLLSTQEDLNSVLASEIKELWIDTARGLDVADEADGVTESEIASETNALLQTINSPRSLGSISLAAEIEKAQKLCDSARKAVVTMFSNARMGKAIDFAHAQRLVDEISASITRHPHAFISLARLKNVDNYTYLHSVAVCGLMVALARQMEMTEQQVKEAGIAGLFHDIGKIGIPEKILNKPGKLTDSEFIAIKAHPKIGEELLRNSQQVSPLTLDVCRHHHEKIDGTGYPDRLKGDEISVFARMGAVCDVYDAITSDRPYKKGWQPAESVHKMAEWSKDHFDSIIFQAFVKTVGIYPTGTLVRLASGRLGVVMEQHPSSLLTPKVKIFFSTKSRVAIAQQIIDLAELKGADKIVGREAVEDWGFKNLDTLWKGTD